MADEEAGMQRQQQRTACHNKAHAPCHLAQPGPRGWCFGRQPPAQSMATNSRRSLGMISPRCGERISKYGLAAKSS